MAPRKNANASDAKAKAKKPKGPAKTKAKASGAKAKAESGQKKQDNGKHPGGRPTKYKPEYANVARVMCSMGATDAELAAAFDVAVSTIWRWSSSIPEFCSALKIDKGEYDERIKRSLAQRALGYTYEAVKIFMPAGADKPVYAPYMEHVPPDAGAAKIWLCNRLPDEWREKVALTNPDGGVLEVRMVA